MNVFPVSLVHLALAVVFFYILNWIGRHTISLGYLQLSIFVRQDEAPAFNFILRTVSPSVYIIILSAILYAVREENLIRGIWRVVPMYFAFRATYNIAFGRTTLINWRAFVVQAIVASTLSWFLYSSLILTKRYIVPDVGTMANELWLVIILFLYSVLNRIQTSDEGTRRRKAKYLKDRYSEFKKLYGGIVEAKARDKDIHLLAYAIMIYENFGRPPIVRAVESAIPKKGLTRGLMQVRTDRRVSDTESVELAIEKLNKDYDTSLAETGAEMAKWVSKADPRDAEFALRKLALRKVIALYNKDIDYINEVQEISDLLERMEKKV